MKTLVLAVGVVVLASGLFWAAQGAGYVSWPRESFMISQSRWIYYGLGTALLGLAVIVWSRRLR
ncbi:MAG: hypothetical protein ABW275_09150 [Hansschlegelia sp.]